MYIIITIIIMIIIIIIIIIITVMPCRGHRSSSLGKRYSRTSSDTLVKNKLLNQFHS